MKKKLPIGIENFKEVIEKNYYFFDKSGLIEKILEKSAGVTLFTRNYIIINELLRWS